MIEIPVFSTVRRFRPHLLSVLAGLALPLSVTGCGDSVAPAASLHPVKGKVKLEGPGSLSGMKITFLPNGPGARTASGDLRTDGSFELTTSSPGDGIAEGSYKIRLDQVNPVLARKSKPAPLTVPMTYLDEDSSGLVATITSDTTEVGPFVLSSRKRSLASATLSRNTD